jgi:hypothetical protein
MQTSYTVQCESPRGRPGGSRLMNYGWTSTNKRHARKCPRWRKHHEESDSCIINDSRDRGWVHRHNFLLTHLDKTFRRLFNIDLEFSGESNSFHARESKMSGRFSVDERWKSGARIRLYCWELVHYILLFLPNLWSTCSQRKWIDSPY